MTLKIVRSTDPIEVNQIVTVVYGQPGAGKTSLGFTSSRPLLLDFDKGAHRSEFRQDSVQVEGWNDITSLTPDDLANYDTLIVDTAGRALDALTADIISGNRKLGRSDGMLTLQGYGALKGRFSQWLKLMRSYSKDVILLAHDKEDKRNDDLIIRPDLTGGSYAEVFKAADAVGYLSVINNERVLDFNPTESYVGKNPAGFDPVKVPSFHQEPDFMAELIQRIKDAIGAISARGQEVAGAVSDFREKLAEIEDADGLNKFIDEMHSADKAVAAQVKPLFAARMKELDCTIVDGKVEPNPDEAA